MMIRPIDIKVFETCIGFLAADIQMAVPGSTVECKVSFLHRRFQLRAVQSLSALMLSWVALV